MSIVVDVYVRRKKERIMRNTWGHLAPKKGKTYKGYMIWVHGGWGDIVLLDATFKGLSSSPWLYEAMQEYIGEHCQHDGVYRWEGQFTQLKCGSFCFGGEIKRLDFKDIFAKTPPAAKKP